MREGEGAQRLRGCFISSARLDVHFQAQVHGRARYGDSATTPRIAAQLRRGRSKTTGSRTGFSGNLQIYVPGPDGLGESIDGSKFYDERYWDPAQYRQWHDSIWSAPKVGKVEVGEIEQVGSRIPATAPEIDAEAPPVPDTP